MKKLRVVQITALLIVSAALGGLVSTSDIYTDVREGIVSVLCLSCIKLEPKTLVEFTFDTANNEPHADFVLENITSGPIFIFYSEDACHACDLMEPVVKDMFQVDFNKNSWHFEHINYNDTLIPFLFTNIDHSPTFMRDSLSIYDKDHIQGLPMFTLVTVNYDRGIVKPFYTSVYGTLTLDTDEERKQFLVEMINDGIELYNEFITGYNPE